MFTYFVSFWLNGWNTDLGLETERHHIASFDVGGDESLASKSNFQESKLLSQSQIDADFWPSQRLKKKNYFEGRRLCVPFKMARLHLGSWINQLCQQSLDMMWRKRELLRESNVMILHIPLGGHEKIWLSWEGTWHWWTTRRQKISQGPGEVLTKRICLGNKASDIISHGRPDNV